MHRHTVLCIVLQCAALYVGTGFGWEPTGVARLPYDVERPAVAISTSSAPSSKFDPFTFTDFGLPVVVVGEGRSMDGERHTELTTVQRFFPLQATIVADSVPVNRTAPLSGPTSVVMLPNGTALALSMCSGTASQISGDSISVFDDTLRAFTEVWTSAVKSAQNASCVVVEVIEFGSDEDLATNRRRTLVGIVGGDFTESTSTTLGMSFFDPATLELHKDVVLLPVDGLVHAPGTTSAVVDAAVTQASDGTLCVAGGVVRVMNASSGSEVLSTPNHVALAITLRINRSSTSNESCRYNISTGAVFRLPPLPTGLLPNATALISFASAMFVFEDSLYYAALQTGYEGTVGMLSLSHFMSEDVGSSVWSVMSLGGSAFDRQAATLIFIPLQREGCVLGLFAVGGTPTSESSVPSVSYMTIQSSLIPSLLMVPYDPQLCISVCVENASLVSVAVSYELIGAGATGLLGLGTSASCVALVSPLVPYDGSIHVAMRWTIGIESAVQSLSSRHLYLCFSDNETVMWGSSEEPSESILFTAINPLEPLLFPLVSTPTDTPTPTPSSTAPQNGVLRFFQHNWYYVAIGVLAGLSVVAVGVSVRLLRRNGLRRTLSMMVSERSPLLDSSGQPKLHENSIKVSTNSHSSRYVTLFALSTLDGESSDVTFAVQRRRDQALLVMKYIVCEGDVERLMSMQEFEALNLLQGHPNVVQYIDMFMNYAFSHTRLGRSHDTRHMLHDAALPTDSSLNTTTYRTPQQSGLDTGDSLGGSPSRTASLLSPKMSSPRPSALLPPMENLPPAASRQGDATTNNHRYVCLVMEYMPQGNIGQWLLRQAEQRLPMRVRSRKTAVDDLPPASEPLILSVALQVNSLLKFMHFDSEFPLAHKGLKPENVLVSGPCNQNGTFVPVAVSDFGFSVLGNFTPPSRMAAQHRRRDSNEMDAASDNASRSSMSQPMDTSGFLQSPKCDMWCFGCLLFALCTYRFGRRFPYMAELVAAKPEKLYQDIQAEMRSRGYSRELTSLTISLLHWDDKLRPSSESVARMFVRSSEGVLSLAVPTVK